MVVVSGPLHGRPQDLEQGGAIDDEHPSDLECKKEGGWESGKYGVSKLKFTLFGN